MWPGLMTCWLMDALWPPLLLLLLWSPTCQSQARDSCIPSYPGRGTSPPGSRAATAAAAWADGWRSCGWGWRGCEQAAAQHQHEQPRHLCCPSPHHCPCSTSHNLCQRLSSRR
ncbi:hypothetical protein V8C86DRAFT_2562684, partial [Haematococcus lacustris]